MNFQNNEHTINFQKSMWQVLMLGLRQIDPTSPEAEEILKSGVFSGLAVPEPSVEVGDNQVSCGQTMLDLSGAEMTYKVFEAFVGDRARRLSRSELVKLVYGVVDFESLSIRKQESLKHSVVKLVSRARRVAKSAFSGSSHGFLEWFPYDIGSGRWRLVRVSEMSHYGNPELEDNLPR